MFLRQVQPADIRSALRFSSTTLTNYSSTSNHNNFYAGTPGTQNVIFYNGTSSYQIEAFKTLVTPRDAASWTEYTPFMNTSTTPYDLHISSSTPTFCESNGVRITSPIAITDDIDGQPRYGETGYSGTGTASDIGADEGNFMYLTPSNATVSISENVCSGSYSGIPVTLAATPTNGGTNPLFQWNINGSNVGTNSSSSTYSYTPTNNDVIYCVITTFNYITGSPATSNSITLTVYPHQTKHYVATTGANNPCSGTLSNPWLTIQYAINNSIAGDTIIVGAGSFNERLAINKAIMVCGAKYGIDARTRESDTTGTGETIIQGATITTVNNQVIILDGFLIQKPGDHSNPNGWGIYVPANSLTNDRIQVTNNIIQHLSCGMELAALNGASSIIRYNLFKSKLNGPNGSQLPGDGLYVEQKNQYIIIEDNKFEDLGYTPLVCGDLGSVHSNITFTNNEIYRTQQTGVTIAGICSNITVTNNYIEQAYLAGEQAGHEWDKGGIRVYGPTFNGPIIVSGNTVVNSYNGFTVKKGINISSADIHVNNNSFINNTHFAIYNGAATGTLDATCNWFG